MIDLQPFCAFGASAISSPWSFGNHTYATDGKMLVRVERRPDVPERPDAPGPVDETIIAPHWPAAAHWSPLPQAPPTTVLDCEMCSGDGVHQCRCGDEHRCGYCRGTTQTTTWPVMKIGHRFISARYVQLTASLPGPVEMAAEHGAALEPLAVRFAGGVGLIMPLRDV